ncbi:MAG: response regulator [Clostridia bacterium]|nr:response regulator [Clostridia bacterium]
MRGRFFIVFQKRLELLKTLLSRTMIQIDGATNGIDCIRLAVSRTYDVIVLDYMMPAPDGIGTLSRMKQRGIKAAFIALTADAIAGTGAKMMAAGFGEYVTKPVDWKKFPRERLQIKQRY